MATTKQNIGKIPIMKGEYQEGATYQRLNQVTMLGSTYQSKIDGNTSAPAQLASDGSVENINTDKWIVIAVGNVSTAKKVVYNNETSGLEAGNVQEAIDEIDFNLTKDINRYISKSTVRTEQGVDYLNKINVNIHTGDLLEIKVDGDTEAVLNKVLNLKIDNSVFAGGTFARIGESLIIVSDREGTSFAIERSGSGILKDADLTLTISVLNYYTRKELDDKIKEVNNELAKKANAEDVSSQMQTEQERVNVEFSKKLDKASITQELGENLNKVTSQKCVKSAIDEIDFNLTKDINRYISKSTVRTEQGVDYLNKINVNIHTGDLLEIKVDGDTEAVLNKVLNLKIDNSVFAGGTFARIGESLIIVSDREGTSFAIERSGSGILKDADLTLTVSVLNYYTRKELDDKIKEVNTAVDEKIDAQKQWTQKAMYVSTDGDDNNNGTSSNPKKTINNCLENGANLILVKSGIYFQNIDLSKSKHNNIWIRGIEENNKVEFYSPEAKVIKDANVLDNHSKVYCVAIDSGSFSFNKNNKWLYQDGVNDASTFITDSERLPQQRGYVYRCDSTKIVLCESTTVLDAIKEIESSSSFKWYYDTDENKLYFSSPAKVTEQNPIIYPKGSFIKNTRRDYCLEIENIHVKYQIFTINNVYATIKNCSAKYVFGDAFDYMNSIVTFIRCEAACAVSGATGDGFNGHATKKGDPFAKTCVCSLYDCWSHDNNDDGYSDHERAETVLYGGLFEYNGKAGVTPSYGSHCSCFNVYSRKNYSGFLCVGAATTEEGGKYSQMLCYNCVSVDNTRGGMQKGFGVSGQGNKAYLFNCYSINDKTAYYADSNANMEINNCYVNNATTKKEGNVTVINAEIVS